jgi:hypothetical protein
MPVVFVPGKGNIQFPDNMTPYEIDLAIRRQILPGRKPETISAPKKPEPTFTNVLKGAGENLMLGLENVREAVKQISPGDLIESGLVTAGQVITAPQVLQNRLFDAIGLGQKAPPPPTPAGPRVSQIINQAIGLGSPEERARKAAEDARRAATYGAAATRSTGEQRRLSQQAEAEAAKPEFQSVLGEGLYSGVSSLAQMAPGVAASLLTRSATPALASAGMLSASDQYFNVLDRGGTKEEALQAAQLTGATEVATEILPMGAVLNGLGKVGVGKFLRDYLGKDLPTELVATITQNAIDTAIANPDKTWGDYLSELPRDLGVTAISTLVPGAALGATSKGLQVASRLAERGAPEDEIAAALQGTSTEAAAPRTAPRPPSPPVDMGALSQALGPIGGKITLQEPTGPQEYTYEGLDEDGSVLLADADGSIFAEDPDQISAAMKAGVAEPEDGLGGMAFGEDITEGLPKVEPVAAEPAPEPVAEPEPVVEERAPSAAPEPTMSAGQFGEFLEQNTGRNLPFAEGIPEQLKAMERSNTPRSMELLESEARQIAANENAEVVSSEHFARALNNAATRTSGREVPFAGDFQAVEQTAIQEPPASAPPAPPAAIGKTAKARVPSTMQKVDVQYELQDLGNINFAEGELQNRDRSRPQTQQFLRDFTSTFDPEALGEDNATDRGAPIINKDNTILSGNGRTMGLEEIYANYPEQAEAYRSFLRGQGYDTEGMERPVLVRRLLSDVDERQFVVGSNVADIAALSPPELARQDAQDILTPEVLATYYGGDLKAAKNDAFVGRFIAKLSAKERGDAMDAKGNPSAQVLQRIRNALLYKAYGESGKASDIFISKAMERADDDTKTLTNALIEASNDWIKFQRGVSAGKIDPKYDITDKLMEAVAAVSDIKERGLKVRDYLRSEDLVEPLDPFVKDILLAFHNDNVSRFVGKNVISNILSNYAETAADQQAAPDMLGMAETPSAGEIWRRVDRETDKSPKAAKAQGQMFKSPAEAAPNLDDFSPEARDIITQAIKVPSLSRNIRNLLNQYYLTEIDEREFVARVDDLLAYTQDMRSAKEFKKAVKGRARGADQIRSRLYAARRNGIFSDEEVDFMIWALDQNPNLANELGISIVEAKDRSPAGQYLYVEKVMKLFKGLANDSTAVHEMLHHTERMMPEDVQEEIRKTWVREFNKAEKKAEPGSALATYFKALRATHSGSTITIGKEVFGPEKGYDIAMNMISLGYVPYSYYQYTKPSEFWAVNATDIMQKRYDVKDSTLSRIRNWLSELVEKAKGLFNASPKAPLIKALDSLIKADGKFNSKSMLDQPNVYYMKGVEQAKKPDVKVKDNAQVVDVLNDGSPEQMKKAVAEAQKTNDKVIQEGADLQKKNRGCD